MQFRVFKKNKSYHLLQWGWSIATCYLGWKYVSFEELKSHWAFDHPPAYYAYVFVLTWNHYYYYQKPVGIQTHVSIYYSLLFILFSDFFYSKCHFLQYKNMLTLIINLHISIQTSSVIERILSDNIRYPMSKTITPKP